MGRPQHAGPGLRTVAPVSGRTVGRVGELWRYPVKSMRGSTVAELLVTERGGLGDRVWALRDPATGRIASAKRFPRLLEFRAGYEVEPTLTTRGRVRIEAPGGQPVYADQQEAFRAGLRDPRPAAGAGASDDDGRSDPGPRRPPANLVVRDVDAGAGRVAVRPQRPARDGAVPRRMPGRVRLGPVAGTGPGGRPGGALLTGRRATTRTAGRTPGPGRVFSRATEGRSGRADRGVPCRERRPERWCANGAGCR